MKLEISSPKLVETPRPSKKRWLVSECIVPNTHSSNYKRCVHDIFEDFKRVYKVCRHFNKVFFRFHCVSIRFYGVYRWLLCWKICDSLVQSCAYYSHIQWESSFFWFKPLVFLIFPHAFVTVIDVDDDWRISIEIAL